MFVKTNPQRSLLECEFLIPKEKLARLKKSWAHQFREHILPLVDEEVFRDAFSESAGRPNKSVRLLLCLHLLKELNDLTDEQVLEQFEYNLQWQYALGIEPESAHLCQKTMHNFRVMLMNNNRAYMEFEHVTRSLAEQDGVSLKLQRLDSTHVLSTWLGIKVRKPGRSPHACWLSKIVVVIVIVIVIVNEKACSWSCISIT